MSTLLLIHLLVLYISKAYLSHGILKAILRADTPPLALMMSLSPSTPMAVLATFGIGFLTEANILKL